MTGINLNKLTKDLNNTFQNDVEYSRYCIAMQYSSCMGISDSLPLFVG